MKNELKIDKGLPIPNPRNNSGFSAAIRSLKKGDSVFLPTLIQNAVSICYRINPDRKAFTRRSVEGGTRVWRIK